LGHDQEWSWYTDFSTEKIIIHAAFEDDVAT